MMPASIIHNVLKMINVRPIKTAAAYVGGKHKLANRIVNMINEINHKCYAEPFCGMGNVFFSRSKKPKAEVINDRSGDIANFFRILQRHYLQLIEILQYQITSRREFDRLNSCDPTTLTDLERAARFIYLQKTCYGGKVVGRHFGVEYNRGSRFNLLKLEPIFKQIHSRLAGVVLENLDWLDFINRYDRAGTLFYCDPPYWGTEKYYGSNLFGRDQFALMAKRLKNIKGHFIMSINDVPEIWKLFEEFKITKVGATYSIGDNKAHKASELIITNAH